MREQRVNLNGQELWAVDYLIAENNLALGLGGQIYLVWNRLFGSIPNSEVIERHYIGTEYFAYSDDPRVEHRRIASVENMRQIVEQGYIANRDAGNLRQGIIVLGTAAVALPVAHVAAPAAAAVTGTSTGGTLLGMTTSGALTGGVSLGSGTAFGHWVVGDSGWEIAEATGWGTLQGVALGGVLGGAARFDMNLTGASAFKPFYGPWAGMQTEFVAFRPPLVSRPAHMPMTGYTWNQVLQVRYGAANVEWIAPRLAAAPLTQGVLCTPAGDYELASTGAVTRRVYSVTMPKGSRGFDIVTRTHTEGQAAAIMQRQGISEGILYINNPVICPSCSNNLPLMLVPGSGRVLHIVMPNGDIVPFP